MSLENNNIIVNKGIAPGSEDSGTSRKQLHGHNKFTILIIDDTYTNVLILEKTLSNSGYSVITAESGPEGRRIAQDVRPDLILLDIMMPDEDGFETISKLKANPSTASIPVIFLTALSDVESKIKGFELGAVDFITKPFHPAEIRARTGLHIKLSIATNALIDSQREKLKQIETAQQALLVEPAELPEANFRVFYSSLHEAGGDFYDVIQVTDNTYGYFLADVSGHDIATGFITASVKALLRQNCSPIYTPSESMRIINRVLLDVLPPDKYLTASYLTLNRKTSKIVLVNMGHPPVLYIPVDDEPQMILAKSDILGGFTDVLFSEYEFKVKPGDRVFMYSDGLIEASQSKSVWSKNIDGLLEIAPEIRSLPLEKTVTRINEHYFGNSRTPEDDIVIMALEV